jgi:hypothetical protein
MIMAGEKLAQVQNRQGEVEKWQLSEGGAVTHEQGGKASARMQQNIAKPRVGTIGRRMAGKAVNTSEVSETVGREACQLVVAERRGSRT